MAYTSEANIEAYMGEAFDATTTPSTTNITLFITWAQALIDKYTGTKFEATTVTDEILDSEGGNRFKLPKRPIVSVTNFYIDNGGLGNTTDWDELSEGRTGDEDFVILEDEGVLYFHNNVPRWGIQNIKTTYVYGYSTVPVDVAKLATLLVVREIVRGRIADNIYSSQDSISVGPISVSKAGSQSTSAVAELESEITDLWKAVGRFKSILH
jgi:hypothetical protein